LATKDGFNETVPCGPGFTFGTWDRYFGAAILGKKEVSTLDLDGEAVPTYLQRYRRYRNGKPFVVDASSIAV